MKFVSIPYNDFIYEIFIYEMLCEIFVRGRTGQSVTNANGIPKQNDIVNVDNEELLFGVLDLFHYRELFS
jgi:hypothetical protein